MKKKMRIQAPVRDTAAAATAAGAPADKAELAANITAASKAVRKGLLSGAAARRLQEVNAAATLQAAIMNPNTHRVRTVVPAVPQVAQRAPARNPAARTKGAEAAQTANPPPARTAEDNIQS